MTYTENHNSFNMLVKFTDNKTDKIYERTVSLQNIFKHNDGLYESLVNCNSLFCFGPKISYNDLSDNIKYKIDEAFTKAKSNDFIHFLSQSEM